MIGGTGELGEPGATGGPALALASAVRGPRSETAVTSEISPSTSQRTSLPPCAFTTRRAVAQAPALPCIQ